MTNKKIYKLVILADEIRRSNLIEWSYFNRESLQPYEIIGNNIAAEILQGTLNMPVDRLAQEAIDENKKLLGLLSDNSVDAIIVFGNPFKTELYPSAMSETCMLAIEKNIVIAFNPATAEHLLLSLRMNGLHGSGERRMKIA